ncbi:hypothetical protein [Pseudomonas coronafaciens]|uniref:hypothetical protein n=1 Tax=Pseudomonas coronafaciens TaxID=53409 RepID=UPI0011C3D72E|nr:hypothetical protein [Pseudomonas coronafaciens]
MKKLSAGNSAISTMGVVSEFETIEFPDRRLIIIQALDELLASRNFSRASRLSQLLDYLVKARLSNEVVLLTEYEIGVAVFRRDINGYHPGDDPIVRVQMGRLRRRLKDYYSAKPHSVRFEIPLGRYGVRFFVNEPTAAPSNPNALRVGLDVSWIGVEQDCLSFADVLRDELAYHAYQTFPSYLEVIICNSANTNIATDYIISVSIRGDGHDGRIIAKLVCCRSGRLFWAGQFKLKSESATVIAQQNVAECICEFAQRFLP